MGAGVMAAAGGRRDLTPAGHARIRRYLALIPVFMWLVFSGSDLLMRLPFGLPGAQVRSARDFVQFYVQGAVVNRGNTQALYDANMWMQLLRRQVPGAPDSDLHFPPVYGPQLALLFSPLAHLTYDRALSVFLFMSLAIYLACGYAVWKACPSLRAWPEMVAFLLLSDPALHYTLRFTQISVIGLLCVTGGYVALRANRPFLAGLAIGSLIYKPQSGLAAAVIFICAREWRIVLGAIVGAAVHLAIGGVFLGTSVVAAYGRSLLHMAPDYSPQSQPFKFHMHSWSAFFELLALPGWMATAAYVATAAVTLILAVRCWRASGPLALRYSVFLIATVLVNPHLYAYDFIVLAPAFLLLWNWALAQRGRAVGEVFPALPIAWLRARSFSTSLEWLLYFCYMSPVFAIVAAVFHVQLSVLALALLGGVLSAVLLSPSGRASTGWSTA